MHFVPYLLVFPESSLCSAEVCLQLFPPVLFLCQTGLQKSEPLLAAVPEVLLYISDDTEHLQEGTERVWSVKHYKQRGKQWSLKWSPVLPAVNRIRDVWPLLCLSSFYLEHPAFSALPPGLWSTACQPLHVITQSLMRNYDRFLEDSWGLLRTRLWSPSSSASWRCLSSLLAFWASPRRASSSSFLSSKSPCSLRSLWSCLCSSLTCTNPSSIASRHLTEVNLLRSFVRLLERTLLLDEQIYRLWMVSFPFWTSPLMFLSFCCSLAASCSASCIANWTNTDHTPLGRSKNNLSFFLFASKI